MPRTEKKLKSFYIYEPILKEIKAAVYFSADRYGREMNQTELINRILACAFRIHDIPELQRRSSLESSNGFIEEHIKNDVEEHELSEEELPPIEPLQDKDIGIVVNGFQNLNKTWMDYGRAFDKRTMEAHKQQVREYCEANGIEFKE